MPLDAPNNDTVTLKVNGKAYTCKNGPVKKRCNSKEFRIDPQAKEPTYACIECGWLMFSSPGYKVEAFLPPRNDWQTPGGSVSAPEPSGLWTTLHNEYGFNVDLAASRENRKTLAAFDETLSALEHDWTPEVIIDKLVSRCLVWNDEVEAVVRASLSIGQGVRGFGNPPYKPAGTIETWLTKAIEQCALGVWSGWLIPMSSSVGWFNDFVVPYGQWSTFNGRIQFIDPLATEDSERTSPKQDNLWVVFDPMAEPHQLGHVAHRDAKTGEYIWRRT